MRLLHKIPLFPVYTIFDEEVRTMFNDEKRVSAYSISLMSAD